MENDLKNIVIVDDHKLFSQSLKKLLHHHFEGVEIQEASGGTELFKMLEKQGFYPDIILLDLEMPDMNGLEIARNLLSRETSPAYKIIVLTMHDEKSFILDMIEAGVHGYVLKDADISETVKAIQLVNNGQYYVSQNTFDAIRQDVSSSSRFKSKLKGSNGQLSTREEEILRLICEEYTNKEIAQKLELSTRTIDGHRNRILKKTGMKNTAGLVKYALHHGLYSLD